MAGFTDYLENLTLDHIFRAVAYTPVTTCYVALYTTTPTDVGTDGVEVTGGSYARQAVTFGAASAGVIANTGVLTFANLPACTVLGFAVVDALTAGNVLTADPLTASRTFAAADNGTFVAGALTVSVS
jgi:hypothetical protein